jgi:cytochrome P450
MNNEPSAAEFPERWREALSEMQREWQRLQQENTQLRTERDQLAKALLALLHTDEITLTDEEILAQIGREKPFSEFLQEMRALVAAE